MSLEVNDLTVSLSNGETVVEHISFQVAPGEMLSVVGSSGAGKTTICRAVMGLLGAAYRMEGMVLFQGNDLLTMPKKNLQKIYGKKICLIMQNPMTAFNPSVRIGRQLEKTYLRHNGHIEKNELYLLLEKQFQKLGLNDMDRILKSYPFALSGGMLQRLMIAAALMNQPKVLVADEATTAIDASNRKELMDELRSLCDEGMSILLVTHDLRAASYSDHILIMNQGKVVESGQTNRVLEAPKEAYTAHLLHACHLERRRRE